MFACSHGNTGTGKLEIRSLNREGTENRNLSKNLRARVLGLFLSGAAFFHHAVQYFGTVQAFLGDRMILTQTC